MQHLFEHLYNTYLNTSSSESRNGFLDDASIIFVDKTDPKDPNKWEHYWRHTLKTMAPECLNFEDD